MKNIVFCYCVFCCCLLYFKQIFRKPPHYLFYTVISQGINMKRTYKAIILITFIRMVDTVI